jgi:hypothetical protein
LNDPSGQGSSPKDFICRLDLSSEIGLRPRKEKFRFGCFWTSQWAFENAAFSPVVHRDSQGFTKSVSLHVFFAFFCMLRAKIMIMNMIMKIDKATVLQLYFIYYI